MAQMWMPPSDTVDWSLFDFSLVFIMWGIMMIAMMLPSTLPLLSAFARICQKRHKPATYLTFVFTLGYCSTWLLFSLLLTLLQCQMHGLLWLTPMMDNANRTLAVGILILAGTYQFLPLKNACLKHCQSPLGFLLNHWQDHANGAFRMGVQHGTICLGCCWAEMLVMFALGVMNITGMIMITLLITLEKLSPLSTRLTSSAGALIFFSWAGFLSFIE